MTTTHINAPDGAFAPTVLLPGDPLRAQWIAEEFLVDAERVSNVRNMFGFTGSTSDGRRVSVMGTGMGVPSISIYATELINAYACERLIRIGSCGSIQEHVQLRHVIVATGACTDSGVNRQRFAGFDFAATADHRLAAAVVAAADARATDDVTVHVGNIMTSDLFYPPITPTPDDTAPPYEFATRMGVLGVEMEAAGLYGVAAQYGAAALAICTVSDEILTGKEMSSDARQTSLVDMVELALSVV